MTIIPRLDYIVLKVEQTKESKTRSGIVMVKKETNEDRQQIGVVVAVGEGRILEDGRMMPINLKSGTSVIFNKYAGTEIKVGEESYIIIHERDVIATVTVS